MPMVHQWKPEKPTLKRLNQQQLALSLVIANVQAKEGEGL